ncbi:MAG: OsmC family protein [Sphaerochaetaceae bacterium]|jgi:peroxiredoxin-like protein
MNLPFQFDTSLTWSSERKGVLKSPGLKDLEVASPVEFSGHPNIWSPEHLYIAAAEVCLMTTFLAISDRARLSFVSYSSTASGIVEKTEEGLRVTTITIKPTVTVSSEQEREKAMKLLESSKRHCLISHSMKTEVTMEATVEVV